MTTPLKEALDNLQHDGFVAVIGDWVYLRPGMDNDPTLVVGGPMQDGVFQYWNDFDAFDEKGLFYAYTEVAEERQICPRCLAQGQTVEFMDIAASEYDRAELRCVDCDYDPNPLWGDQARTVSDLLG